MNPVFVPGPGVLVSPAVASRIRRGLLRELRAAQRQQEIVPTEVVKTIEMIDDVGAWWETKGVSRVSSDLSSVDPSSFDAVELISVKTTAHILEITPQAVTGLLARGSLQGQKRGREWFVDAASVKARKEVSA